METWKLGSLTIQKGAALAPMAGVTDTTMRALCAQHGAVYTVSEMISAKALVMGDRKSPRLMAGGGGSAPYGIQLFGAEPEAMGQAAALLAAGHWHVPFDFIDINMGCPAPKITGPGGGSALLRDPQLAGRVAQAVVQGAGGVPVTAKLRIGWDADSLTGAEVAKRCEDAGVQMLTVHGRTRQEMYRPGVHADEIARVRAAVGIPVLANGDVTDVPGALALMQATGCDGVAVGRGAMGNPWLFDALRAAFAHEPIPGPPGLHERFAVLRSHIYGMCEDKGEYVAMQQARTHAAWYMHGLRGAAQLRRVCCGMTHFTDVDRLIDLAWRLQEQGG